MEGWKEAHEDEESAEFIFVPKNILKCARVNQILYNSLREDGPVVLIYMDNVISICYYDQNGI